jgi:hypothetical protein
MACPWRWPRGGAFGGIGPARHVLPVALVIPRLASGAMVRLAAIVCFCRVAGRQFSAAFAYQFDHINATVKDIDINAVIQDITDLVLYLDLYAIS